MNKLYRKDIIVTISLLLLLLAVFIVEIFLGGSENTATLIRLGAMNNYTVAAAGQWWRLFTAQFLHIGIMHLVSNAVMIYYLGMFLEPLLGHIRFLAVYLISGIGGNLLSFALGDDRSISAGASTALFGLFGALIAVGVRNATSVEGSNSLISYISRQAFVLALINIGLDLFIPNIDLQGHLGGLFTGAMLTIILGNRATNKFSAKVRIISGVILIIYAVATIRLGMVISF